MNIQAASILTLVFFVLFSDGVGEGQLQLVVDYEVKGTLKVLKDFCDYEPKLAFFVVSKRINTR